MHAFSESTPAISRAPQDDRFKEINAVKLTGDQLNRAFHMQGACGDDAIAILTAFAEREGIIPVGVAAQALVLRMGLVCDFLEGPGIENDEWGATLEAIARVRLTDDEDALAIGESGICFDEAMFDEMREFAREMPW